MMNRIHCNYYRPKEVSIDEYENIVGKMELDLKQICCGEAGLCPEILEDKAELSWEHGRELRQAVRDIFPGLLSSMKDIEHRLSIGNVRNEWGEDYTEEAMKVVMAEGREKRFRIISGS